MSRAPRGPTLTAWLFGLLHALVDTASLAVLYHEVAVARLPYERICGLIFVYNCIAFGAQPLLGLLTDRLGRPTWFAAAGTGIAALAVALSADHPQAAAVCVATGNALFHVGAGAVVLGESGGRAARPGIFVAPGAFGVWLGIQLGMRQCLPRGILMVCLGAAAVLLARSATPASVAADRVGWRLLAVASLLALAPWTGRALASAGGGAVGMFLIQLAMPVTLTAVFAAMPRNPGTAFGLPSLALWLGALPAWMDVIPVQAETWLWVLVPVSAVLVYLGLCFLPGPSAHPEAS